MKTITIEQMHPRGSCILTKPIKLPDQITDGGIKKPDTAEKDVPLIGLVLAVGEGHWRVAPDGSEHLVPLKTTVGSYVLYGKYAGQKIEINFQTYLILQDAEILLELDASALDEEPVPA